ncbi:hypothetical protein GP486_008411, partial [Trichoglossum hirsutum]
MIWFLLVIALPRYLGSTSLGGKVGGAINLGKLASRDTYTVGELPQAGIQVTLYPSCYPSIWTSAVSKVDGTAAVGTSRGIIIIKEIQHQWRDQGLELPSDVFALEFLRPDLLACGSRDGALRLVDTRLPTAYANSDPSFTIRHPSSITHIRQTNENHVVVCGPEDS